MNKRIVSLSVVGILAIGAGAFVTFGLPDSSASQDGVQPVLRHRAGPSQVASKNAAHPKTAHVAVARAGLMPESFRVLLTRSIFSECGQPAGSSTPNDTGMSLRGIMQQGAAFIAFVEDASHGDARQVKLGDSLAGGTVTQIDLHGMELAAGGRKTRVQVGQNVAGGLLVGMPGAPAIADSPGDESSRVATIR